MNVGFMSTFDPQTSLKKEVTLRANNEILKQIVQLQNKVMAQDLLYSTVHTSTVHVLKMTLTNKALLSNSKSLQGQFLGQ